MADRSSMRGTQRRIKLLSANRNCCPSSLESVLAVLRSPPAMEPPPLFSRHTRAATLVLAAGMTLSAAATLRSSNLPGITRPQLLLNVYDTAAMLGREWW